MFEYFLASLIALINSLCCFLQFPLVSCNFLCLLNFLAIIISVVVRCFEESNFFLFFLFLSMQTFSMLNFFRSVKQTRFRVSLFCPLQNFFHNIYTQLNLISFLASPQICFPFWFLL